MKKILTFLLTAALFFSLLFIPKASVQASPGVSLNVSASSVKVGQTVTVKVSVPSGYAASGYISRSSSAFGTASDTPFSIGDAAGQSNSASFSFTAKDAGSCTFTAVINVMGDSEGNAISVSNPSKKVTVENASGDDGTDDGGSSSSKSADNYLSALTLSAGTLSPSFYYATTSYTATVPYSVTSLAVSATPDNAKASVTSVSGNENLQVGSNTISIVVKAENGTTRTYTITVTRQAEDEAASETETEKEEQTFDVNGQKYVLAEEIPEKAIPKDFESSEVTIDGESYPCLQFKKGSLVLLYLYGEGDSEGSFFIYDEKDATLYPFVKIESEKSYVIVLMPKEDQIPQGYEELTVSLDGKGLITAYQKEDEAADPDKSEENVIDGNDTETSWNFGFAETVYADEINQDEMQIDASDFYLIYCINNQGQTGWYQFDREEETYQRYYAQETISMAEPAADETDASLQDKYDDLNAKFNKLEQYSFLAACGAIIIIVILIICLIVSSVGRSKLKKQLKPENTEEAEVDEDDDDEPIAKTEVAEPIEPETAEPAEPEAASEPAEETSVPEVNNEPVEETSGPEEKIEPVDEATIDLSKLAMKLDEELEKQEIDEPKKDDYDSDKDDFKFLDL